MIPNQLKFLQDVFFKIDSRYVIYAADILIQLYRAKSVMSIEEFFRFFRNKNKVDVWETLMLLNEQGYIFKLKVPATLPTYRLTPLGRTVVYSIREHVYKPLDTAAGN